MILTIATLQIKTNIFKETRFIRERTLKSQVDYKALQIKDKSFVMKILYKYITLYTDYRVSFANIMRHVQHYMLNNGFKAWKITQW